MPRNVIPRCGWARNGHRCATIRVAPQGIDGLHHGFGLIDERGPELVFGSLVQLAHQLRIQARCERMPPQAIAGHCTCRTLDALGIIHLSPPCVTPNSTPVEGRRERPPWIIPQACVTEQALRLAKREPASE